MTGHQRIGRSPHKMRMICQLRLIDLDSHFRAMRGDRCPRVVDDASASHVIRCVENTSQHFSKRHPSQRQSLLEQHRLKSVNSRILQADPIGRQHSGILRYEAAQSVGQPTIVENRLRELGSDRRRRRAGQRLSANRLRRAYEAVAGPGRFTVRFVVRQEPTSGDAEQLARRSAVKLPTPAQTWGRRVTACDRLGEVVTGVRG